MKKIAFAIVGAFGLMGSVQAASNNVGCGLGSQVFDGQSGVAPQALAATTNGSSGNQTFGITSGTLGCSKDGVVQASLELDRFVSHNMDQLSFDISAGKGETLNAVSEILGVADGDREHLFSTLKDSFAQIYPDASVSSSDVTIAMLKAISADASLAGYAS